MDLSIFLNQNKGEIFTSPITYKGYTYASDSYIAVRTKESVLNSQECKSEEVELLQRLESIFDIGIQCTDESIEFKDVEKEVERCVRCEGKGKTRLGKCPDCNGEGVVECSFESESGIDYEWDTECKLCDGTGEAYDDKKEEECCPTCSGNGYIFKNVKIFDNLVVHSSFGKLSSLKDVLLYKQAVDNKLYLYGIFDGGDFVLVVQPK